ncbi:family hydrolase [Diaporthe amygdali]|uniref:family hydrolase n=1 Tax=Phomopsis amygdali TaxID=1214568 RepID=UPI0022FDD123|nr:family hydrolase [Diaporthe amygdali]KAJ0125068.1 family hydrolase [Diaporthe amygdali]
MASHSQSPPPAPSIAPENGAADVTSAPAYRPRYIDVRFPLTLSTAFLHCMRVEDPDRPQIGINLADPIFRGVYHGKQRHDDDLSGLVDRARQVGCTKLIVTGSSFKTSREALAIAKEYPGTVFTTAGIHPCSSSIFDPAHPHSHEEDGDGEHTPACGPDPDKPIPDDAKAIDPEKTETIISDLRRLVEDARGPGPQQQQQQQRQLVAFGEFGLDYDRLHYCPRSLQLHSFRAQLSLAASLSPQLPLFLHSRAAHGDFVACLKAAFGERLEGLEKGGVVHSFTGTIEEMRELMDLGLYIGLNGCSFKTAENCEVVRAVRLDRLMIETDGPWCEVRPTHEGWKYLVEIDKKEKAAAEASEAALRDQANQVNGDTVSPPAAKQPPKKQQSIKKPQKKESEVIERFKTVKKEKWVEGAMIKGRNEPCMIERVAKIVAGIKGVSIEEVCEAAWQNTAKVFGIDET